MASPMNRGNALMLMRLAFALAGMWLGSANMAAAQLTDAALSPAADVQSADEQAHVEQGVEEFVRWIDIYPLTPVRGDARPVPPPGCTHRRSHIAGWRAATGETLWLFACHAGNRLFVDAGAGLQAVDLPAALRHIPPAQLSADGDGVLVHVMQASRSGDCGTVARYGWSADGELYLLERHALAKCRGSAPRDDPSTDPPIPYQRPYYRIIGRPVAE